MVDTEGIRSIFLGGLVIFVFALAWLIFMAYSMKKRRLTPILAGVLLLLGFFVLWGILSTRSMGRPITTGELMEGKLYEVVKPMPEVKMAVVWLINGIDKEVEEGIILVHGISADLEEGAIFEIQNKKVIRKKF